MKKNLRLVAAVFLLVLSGFSYPSAIEEEQEGNRRTLSFSRAKTLLHKEVFSDVKTRTTFYCGCKYGENLRVDFESCGYVPGKQKKRAERVEWEHVVPASIFGRHFEEWTIGNPECITRSGKRYRGRRCASKTSRPFRLMEADMYNLVPSVGEINAVRSNYPFTEKRGDERPYGKCDFRIRNRKAEPTDSIRGVIARIYMYMDSAYPGFDIVNESNFKMFEKWDQLHPVSPEECRRKKLIEKIQGNKNHIVAKRCKKLENVQKQK